MALRIEDYGLIGDTQTAGLVGKDGSIDWLCLPRFDSAALFSALLGDESNGHWRIAPEGEVRRVNRCYREGTLVLETEFECAEGTVRVIDFMPPRDRAPDLMRIVEGVRGKVPMELELTVRFGYGSIVPWIRRSEGDPRTLFAVAGPDALRFDSGVDLEARGFAHTGRFTVSEGERIPFVITWYPSHEEYSEPPDPRQALEDTVKWWRSWIEKCNYQGEWHEAVHRSLLVLKALTFAPTGGIVAAPTTSLPEHLGGVRNWDYRYCWIRDATLTLNTFLVTGHSQEAVAWRDWLLRAVAGEPQAMQILYGPAGERRLPEFTIPWLPGYEGAAPVRVGNAAVDQFQLDVYGEIMDAMHRARRAGMEPDAWAWGVQKELLDFLEGNWREPDEGIWEVRGPRRHFTHSKMMAWVAFDRAVNAAQNSVLDGPVERWKRLRSEIHEEVCREGYQAERGEGRRGAFTQFYGCLHLDAAVLMMPLVGFLPATDERVRSTVEAIEEELCQEGFVMRYAPEAWEAVDGLPYGEGAFLPCTFWLADCLASMGERERARAHFQGLLDIRNDLGLLSEGYEVAAGRLVGNFPQAFTHVGLVNTAHILSNTDPTG